ncbi:Asp-tRNA(Asn)/Glu-tRNA(Gln) amidotransferase subunit GatC [Hathewaya histolytica]|uniref:Glutamyl-tRNA(Gln) and/or aspartyl-tRNA(Asn) amidotransferase, C subunit n=1 Tax=Hathewaya histolytica TaxID=1498 RepID=A0A4U9R2D1_HATHI|nr:Asp-tRNA(Asn)/Glu-tRNA(Gln) amidotransferase subunit GatC [Hathewaya histolytica]VTQ85179.1 glutamyl-tRNA(Gln) and/or aspartyl-tRNA(Asn) amidotransferase, C subunit [Hathewaya histolytica]
MKIGTEDVDYLGKMCTIKLENTEKIEIIKELNEIINFVEDIKYISVNDREAINPYYIENNFRDDKVEPSMNIEYALKNASSTNGDYFLVPKIIK